MPPKEYILIRGYGAVSLLGHHPETISQAYQLGKPAFTFRDFNGVATPVGAVPAEAENALNLLAQEKKAYQSLDRSVLLAMLASRQAVAAAGWEKETGLTINIGSSRGATGLFEDYLQEFMRSGSVPVQTSPVTTLGNISSWVAQDLNVSGPAISHSVTCSTGIQALANGFAWLKSGMAHKFLAGAAEAPLTPFTVAQMKALGIYSHTTDNPFPCRPHNPEKKNTFVLGEGAAVFALEKITAAEMNNFPPGKIILESVGFGFENIVSKTGISRTGQNFTLAMQDALAKAANPAPVDLVIMHAPGTVAGDAAELSALEKVFTSGKMPPITSNKWLMGHTLGASAGLSLAYALNILQAQEYLHFPYAVGFTLPSQPPGNKIKRILITAAGFGGNAAALLVSKPN